MTNLAKASHIGSSLSIADILAVLYTKALRYDPEKPGWPDRDRFILSKGHGCAAYYALLAEVGFFPREWLRSFCQNGSILAGHATHGTLPGVEISTGSLGHGLPVACGIALAAKQDARSFRTVCLMSDGECDEGSVWEAALFARQHALDNLIVIIDYNKIQSLGPVKEIIDLEPFSDKWRAFGWAVMEVNGHDLDELESSLKAMPIRPGMPSCVIAHTVKGKGVSFMEHQVLWHYRSPQGEEFDKAVKELTDGESL